MPLDSAVVKAQARALGFNLCGITSARPAPHLEAYLRWIDQGLHGSLNYMARPDRVARRRDLNEILPGARSLILVGLDHHQMRLPDAIEADPTRGRIAMYAWGADYHELMLPRLERLAEQLRAESSGDVRWRAYVDTGAVLERDHAQQAGLGFIGKNTLLIHPRRGSGFFLGEILIDAEVDVYDEPAADTRCGSCTRCLNACPTAAFPEPYVLDARRCISYLTIEHKGSIDRDLRPKLGRWIFGCDICQSVCPWNRFGVTTLEPALCLSDVDRAAPLLADVLALDDERFAARYKGSPLERAGRDRLVRNACLAAGNSAAVSLAPLLRARLSDRSPLVRAHAGWALARLAGEERAAIQQAWARETDPDAREDLGKTLEDANLAAH